ncbi:Protein CBG14695 [Caenorhabditis briggsae]|uniref:Protein CBG14695 n=1 Tax=Caenorhabditis briggsae TaxID=6238 RepID=A8XKH0_CAEBR|nr:Protein CBG14695 [Caenorhabditis briggsae]CAP33144.2 Protein CBG14695 [Caenorhabditis briggsae]
MMREELSTSADDELATTSTSQMNGDPPPKKGILKRPSVVGDEKRDKLFPLPGFRSSPDRFPEKGTTRIPKLQVTWWEKNAVAFIGETSDENNTDSEHLMRDLGNGRREEERNPRALQIRQTAILDSEDSDFNESDMIAQFQTPDIDDVMSVTSSTCSSASAIVGRWWNGKDTRYVPHCQKKGCNHKHHDLQGEYITPTQRRNKELAELKKELRQALSERDEKDKHLSDLRDKVKEIEIFNETQHTLAEGQKMMRKEQLEKEAIEREKKLLEKKHAVRVNQLIQETMTAREEAVKLTSRVAYLEEQLNPPRSDGETQTDEVEREFYLRQNPPDPTDANQNGTLVSQTIQADPSTPLSIIATQPDLHSPSPMMIPLVTRDNKNQTIYCSQEALNHIQACQNEAFIWRNKAAQLEIVAKDQLMKIQQLEEVLQKAMEPPPESHITMTPSAFIVEDVSNTNKEEDPHNVNFSNFISICYIVFFLFQDPIIITDCNFAACLETKNLMKNEIENLRQVFSEAKFRIEEMEEDASIFRRDLEKADDDRLKLEAALKESNEDIDSKAAEIVASLNTANRLQHEKDQMQHAISYMEERMQVYRNTIQDHHLVVSDEKMEDWRKTISDPRYQVMHSKVVQTTLTSQQLSEHESDFLSTQKTLHELQKEYSAKNTTLVDKFKEVEEILLAKTELVDALTKQLEDIRKEQTKELSLKQTERDQYKKSLEEMTLIAEKVPVLEAEIMQLSKDKNEISARLKHDQEYFEDELAKLLNDSMNIKKERDDYLTEHIRANEAMIERLKLEITGLKKDLEDQKMQAHLQKAELEKKLSSTIDHVEQLKSKKILSCILIFQAAPSQRDVECQAIPRQINKYVGCKPNVKNKETIIEKVRNKHEIPGALFDENEERLRICKAELDTTRRQVTVLQQKLVSIIQQQGSQKIKKRIAVVEDTNKNTVTSDDMDTKLREVELKNTELLERINSLEAERFVASSIEKSRIQKLVTEFDNLKQKLDNDMSNYSKEKQWLQWRISNLEKDNSELQKQIQPSIEKSQESLNRTNLRKTMSEPDFGDNMSVEGDAASTNDSAEISSFMTESVTAPVISLHSEQPFSQLADVLNLVRSDLEQVLTEIEEPETVKTDEPQISLEKSTSILNDVLSEWAEDERRTLERQLKRSQEERTILKNKNNRMSKDLQVAMAELNVYRSEKPHKEDEPKILERSSSFSSFNHAKIENDTQKWKEKSGTLFREVNRIRQNLAEALEQNNELRYQLALARGERELSYCIEKDTQYPISPSLSYHTAHEGQRKDDIIVHEPQEPFQLGSSKASLSCSIMIRSNSLDRKSQPRERSRQRSRSANRRPPISKDELSKREKRREMRVSHFPATEFQESGRNESCNFSSRKAYLDLHQSLLFISHQRNNSECLLWQKKKHNILKVIPREDWKYFCRKLPLMSASWHEKALENELLDGDTDYDRRNIRVISLREKVGKLSRENKDLQAKLTYFTASQPDSSKMLELEQETEELKSTVKELLQRVSQATPNYDRQIKLLQDELDIRRQESAMYEKKLTEIEEERKEMYLVMFKKGQQAANMEITEDKMMDAMTEDRVTLKFLHDAFYYYLLNRGDSQEHLSVCFVMMTILGFTAAQKSEIANQKRGRSN